MRAGCYIHYFISSDVLLAHADFFRERVRQTFVLVHGTAPTVSAAFRTLNVCQPYADIVKALLRLEQCGHGPISRRQRLSAMSGRQKSLPYSS